ncbi:MAG: hypothetical protein D6B27_01960 [Gammaproteobacteria bacterium]|nr:MAG: hypothetical protein D6B27_01960 [Gammaproteobacteria bacterium]
MRPCSSEKLTIKTEDDKLTCCKGNYQIDIEGKIPENSFITENSNFLIFTTENCPCEETLHITLLNKNLQIIDQIDIYKPYTPGVFEIISNNCNSVTFSFFPEVVLKLRIKTNGKRFMNSGLYSESKKRLWQKRYLIIEKT